MQALSDLEPPVLTGDPHEGALASATNGGANPIDLHVGRRLRQRRTALGLSQEKLGEALGLTFQQVQKYERGVNRVGASRLYDISRALGVPVCYFYEEIGDQPASERRGAGGQDSLGRLAGPAADPETAELVRAFSLIADQGTRKDVLNIVRRFGQAEA